MTDYIPKEEARQALSRYLSEFVLNDEDSLELRLPEMTIPDGFHLIHNRCSKRCLYEISHGFAVTLRGKLKGWRRENRGEQNIGM